MGKKSRKDQPTKEVVLNGNLDTTYSILRESKAFDPALASLFASSSGPVIPPPISRYQELPPASSHTDTTDHKEQADGGVWESDDDELSSFDGELEDADIFTDADDVRDEVPQLDKLIDASKNQFERKRKRHKEDEDFEGKYLQKLAREEEVEEEQRKAERRLKRQRLSAENGIDSTNAGGEVEEESDEELKDDISDEENGSDSDSSVSLSKMPTNFPLHESLAPSKDEVEVEKASRTVFLANVSTLAISSKSAKKSLLAHMASFIDSLPAPPKGKPEHKVESLRFRSTAYGAVKLPKKAAFAKKELMDATTKSTNAYAVYSTAFAAREAVKRLNGSIVLGRHLRVDGVAHPAKVDHRRCVFVGNLGFVDDESLLDQVEGQRKRSKVPSDIEEGLWCQFGKAGTVESVRVVRDEKTRVGKGFAYVQFQDANAVESALLFDGKKFPPMLPRVLRVVRAKAVRKTALASEQARANKRTVKVSENANRTPIYNPKMTSQQSSFKGRAAKLLGRAGAAHVRRGAMKEESKSKDSSVKQDARHRAIAGLKTPEAIVFEGYRASAQNGKPAGLKLGSGGGKKKGKPRTRSSKRGSEWKKSGGRK